MRVYQKVPEMLNRWKDTYRMMDASYAGLYPIYISTGARTGMIFTDPPPQTIFGDYLSPQEKHFGVCLGLLQEEGTGKITLLCVCRNLGRFQANICKGEL